MIAKEQCVSTRFDKTRQASRIVIRVIIAIMFGWVSLAHSQPAADLALVNSISPPLHRQPAAQIKTESTPAVGKAPLVKVGIGDTVTVQVYGKPDLGTTTTVADDGTILVPLIGATAIAGLSPSEAATKIATALKTGEFLVKPQVTITVVQGNSQQVSVLGEVGKPGRYPVESRTTIFDLLAQAGGKGVEGANVIYLLHTDPQGKITRMPINLDSLTDVKAALPTIRLEGGDTLLVPRAGQFFVYGEVTNPNQYRLDPGMTVIQALTRAGGITRRGSSSRIEIKRRNATGGYETIHPKLTDPVLADDVIRVKESIF